MNKDVDQPDEVTAIVDALAMVNAGLDVRTKGAFIASPEWAEYASKVINQAVAVILEQANADKLQTAIITLLQGLHARAVDDRDAAHAELAEIRAALRVPDEPRETLRERTREALDKRFYRGVAASLMVGGRK